MARRRGRGAATDRNRFPDFEGVTGMEVGGGPNVPGANRGGVGRGAFEQPTTTGPQRRIDGLRASRGASAAAPGQEVAQVARSTPRSSAPSAAAPVIRPVQGGTGALPRVNPRFTGRQRSRRG